MTRKSLGPRDSLTLDDVRSLILSRGTATFSQTKLPYLPGRSAHLVACLRFLKKRTST